ncbi:hypothetical protein ONZ45_g5005 [Pleurotus djamor]|nr:hypothetical protein ONZ45_g5005 [Pleurotus djamor]
MSISSRTTYFFVSFLLVLSFESCFVFAANSCRLSLRQLPRESIDPNAIPDPCQDRCAAVVNTINTCSTITCTCTTNTQYSLVNCLQCIAFLAPGVQEVLDQAQESIDDLERTCREASRPLPHRDVSNIVSNSISTLSTPTISSSPSIPSLPLSSSLAAPITSARPAETSTTGLPISSPTSDIALGTIVDNSTVTGQPTITNIASTTPSLASSSMTSTSTVEDFEVAEVVGPLNGATSQTPPVKAALALAFSWTIFIFPCLSSSKPVKQGDDVPINGNQCLRTPSHPESLMTVIDIRRQTPSLQSSTQEETSEESAVPCVESTQPVDIKESFVASERIHVVDDNNSADVVSQEAADESPRFPKSRKIITDFSAFDTPQASPHPHMNEFAVLRPPPIEHKGLVVSRYTPSELEGSVCSAHGASPCNLCSLSKANLPIKFPF